MFEDKTRQQLAEGISEVLNPPQVGAALPVPDNAPPGLTPEQRQTLHDNWIEHIYSRRPETWKPQERAAVRAACTRALKDLNR